MSVTVPAASAFLVFAWISSRLARARVVASSGGRGVGGKLNEIPAGGGGGGDGGAARSVRRISCFNCSRWRLRRRLEMPVAPVSSSDQIELFRPVKRSAIVNGV